MSRLNNYGPYDNPLFYNRLGSSSSSSDMDPYAQIATNQWQISRPNSIVAAKDSGIETDSYNDGYKEKTSKT
ncbi:hypothetical protein WR25_17522 [Diploscapter pachys]|uniref:Uncharacterized protein n=1 Tax=Diploscapter pachys TaxID=2018661 RepID=A0A2A2L6H3_9BILA|nr:hypothetical protein WR25_17522 [Diploscapter pachys]